MFWERFALGTVANLFFLPMFCAARRVTRDDGQLAQLGMGTTKIMAAAARSISRLHWFLVVFLLLAAVPDGLKYVAAGLTGTPIEGHPKFDLLASETQLTTFQRGWALVGFLRIFLNQALCGAWFVALKEAAVLAADAVVETRKQIRSAPVASAEWDGVVVPRVLGLIQKTMPALSSGFGTSVLGVVFGFWLNALGLFVVFVDGKTGALPWIFVLIAVSVIPVYDVASVSSDCDSIHDSLNDERGEDESKDEHDKLQILEVHLDRLNKKQGLGFVAGGKVIDRTTVKRTVVGIYGFLGFIIPLLLASRQEAAVIGTTHCSLTAAQGQCVQSAMLGHNASCSYDNVSLGSVLRLRLKADDGGAVTLRAAGLNVTLDTQLPRPTRVVHLPTGTDFSPPADGAPPAPVPADWWKSVAAHGLLDANGKEGCGSGLYACVAGACVEVPRNTSARVTYDSPTCFGLCRKPSQAEPAPSHCFRLPHTFPKGQGSKLCAAACDNSTSCVGWNAVLDKPTSGQHGKGDGCWLYQHGGLAAANATHYITDGNLDCGSKTQLQPNPPPDASSVGSASGGAATPTSCVGVVAVSGVVTTFCGAEAMTAYTKRATNATSDAMDWVLTLTDAKYGTAVTMSGTVAVATDPKRRGVAVLSWSLLSAHSVQINVRAIDLGFAFVGLSGRGDNYYYTKSTKTW